MPKRYFQNPHVRARFVPFITLFALVLVAWSVIQLPLYKELAQPWVRQDTLNIGQIIRQMLMIGCEAALITAAMYCMNTFFRHVVILFTGMLCLLTTANLAYMMYFSNIIHLRKVQEFYTLFYIRDQLLFQILSPINYLQLGASMALMAVLWFASAHPRLRTPRGIAGKCLVTIPIVLAFYTLYSLQASRFWQTVTPARQLLGNSTSYFMFGMFPVYGSMVSELIVRDSSKEPVAPVNSSLNAASGRLPMPALDPDAVFFIQAESLDASAVFLLSAHGTPLMPFLRDVTSRSVLMKQFYHHHNGAASASAEIGALLSIVPDAEHNGFLSIRQENYHPLNQALEQSGFESFFLHSNRGSFLGSEDAYRRMKFNHFIDMADFRGDAAGFHARDVSFFQQSLDIINTNGTPGRKPFAYLVTMQSHGPFMNYRPETALALREEGFFDQEPVDALYRDYLCSMRELDEALRVFWDEATRERYRNPLIILYPDHQSGVLDKPTNDTEMGLALIWSPELPPMVIESPISSYDLPPTVMHLLGAEGHWPESAWWIGDSVFTDGPRKIILVHNYILEGAGTNVLSRMASKEEQTFIYFSRDIQN